MEEKSCAHCGGCAKCEPCDHCKNHCRICGKPIEPIRYYTQPIYNGWPYYAPYYYGNQYSLTRQSGNIGSSEYSNQNTQMNLGNQQYTLQNRS